MYDVLAGMRVIEGASFIAAPSCCLHLVQMGAEVIRFDTIGGGPDRNRWPVAPNGASLYWEGLNKGKKSIALDLSRPEGRELAAALITLPSGGGAQPAGGLFVTNFPADGFLSHARLVKRRPDLITLRVMGWASGATAIDYTVNAATGYPLMTGPRDAQGPVNHVLPAWDLLTGAYAAFALMAAERHRGGTGQGQEIRVPLGDVAIATMGNLGQIAEVSIGGADRPRLGNDLFGAFGRDFQTADGSMIMIVAITRRQWTGLLAALEIGPAITALENELAVAFETGEVIRFQHRERLFPIVAAAVAGLHLTEIANRFGGQGVCWDRYQGAKQAVESDSRWTANPILSGVAHPSGHEYLTPGAAATLSASSRRAPGRAPRLGEHTYEVLATLLGLPDHEIARLHDGGVVSAAD